MPQGSQAAQCPISGRKVFPEIYTPHLRRCMIWYFPALFALVGAFDIYNESRLPKVVGAILIAAAVSWTCAVAWYFHRVRLEIMVDGISFSRPFKPSVALPFSEIDSALLVDRQKTHLAKSGEDSRPRILMLIPKESLARAPIEIPLTYFSAFVVDEIVRLLEPHVPSAWPMH
jgi:hypothetical protein